MLVNTYKNSSSSSSSNSRIHPNYSNGLSQTSSLGESEEWFYQFWERYLRKVWHYIVVPPLIVTAKRLQHEATVREKSENNNGENDPNGYEEEFHIDYKLATEEFLRRLFTEFIGTLLLTAVSAALLLEARLQLITIEGATFTDGVAKLFLIYTLGGISGAHFNPAITLGFALRRVFPWIWVLFYWLVQFVGSIVAGLLIRGLFGGQRASLGTSSVNTLTSTVANGFKWEIFLTFILLFVVLQTATKASIIGSQASIAVGATIAASEQIGASKSTGSQNPFRTLGPSIINNSPDNRHSLWIYIAGPLLGTIVAYVVVGLTKGFTPRRNEITSAHGAEINYIPIKPLNKG